MINSNVATVGNYAFASSAVSKVYMPSCTSIVDYGFAECYNLDTSVDFIVSNSCTFGNNCFNGVSAYPPIA